MFVKKEEYLGLKYRVEELENLLCPISGGGHDFVEVEPVYDYQPDDDVLIGHRYQCKRCLKKKFVLV